MPGEPPEFPGDVMRAADLLGAWQYVESTTAGDRRFLRRDRPIGRGGGTLEFRADFTFSLTVPGRDDAGASEDGTWRLGSGGVLLSFPGSGAGETLFTLTSSDEGVLQAG